MRRSAFAFALLGSVLTSVGPAVAQEAPSGNGASEDDALSEVTVTGTRIEGVAPVGTALVQLEREEIAATGLTSTADILNTLPSVLRLGSGNAYAGGQAQQGNTLTSFTYGKSPNIRGFGVGATLSLVNGHRVPYEGGNMNAFDGDNYPPAMIQRIDVVQDGGSALYGADAIAGTINYILRRPENAFEMEGAFGSNDGQDSYSGTAILGRKWAEDADAEGGFIVSYQYSSQEAFSASSRADLYDDDFSAFGGAGAPLYSAPGNIVVGNRYYSIPAGQDGTRLTLSQLGETPNTLNSWTRIEVIPEVDVHRLALNFEQGVTQWLDVFGDALYVERDLRINGPNSSTSNRVSSFGLLPRIPNSNPFSPCNPGHYPGGVVTGPADLVAACGAGSLAIAYSTVYDIGPPTRTAKTETYNFGAGARFSLPHEWSLTLAAYSGTHDAPSITTQSGGAPNPDFATFNFFCDPTQFACTDAATAESILARGRSLINRTRYSADDYSLNASGDLFSLPAGAIKAAIGVQRYEAELLNENNFGGNNLNPREVSSGYAELFLPLVSPDFGIPAVHKLEIDLSARYDDYSDAGITRNPRYGLNWWPSDDLKVFASYSTSFRAPGLADNDPYSQHGVIPGAVSGSQISGAICAACQDPGLASAAIYQIIGGANRDLRPETSETHSLGADWTPQALSGLSTSLKYWWTSYKGQINTPAYNVGPVAAINRGIFNSQVIYSPTLFPALAAGNPVAFFGDFPTIDAANPACAAVAGRNITTQALFASMITCLNTGGETGGLFGAPVDPTRVLALVNGHRINAGTTEGEGIDLSITYAFDTDSGGWKAGVVAQYILDWLVAPIQGAPLVDEVNRFGNPLELRARAHLGWERDFAFGHLLANVFVNYDNAYSMDPGQLPVGVASSYASIDSYTTADLTLRYDTGSLQGSWLTRDVAVTLSIQNLFDSDPPLVLNQAGLAGSALKFDPTYGSPLGRMFQVQLSKKF